MLTSDTIFSQRKRCWRKQFGTSKWRKAIEFRKANVRQTNDCCARKRQRTQRNFSQQTAKPLPVDTSSCRITVHYANSPFTRIGPLYTLFRLWGWRQNFFLPLLDLDYFQQLKTICMLKRHFRVASFAPQNTENNMWI